MPYPSLGTDHCIPWNPNALSQGIRRLETYAVNIKGQPIRILPHPDNRLIAIGLIDTDRTCHANPMRVQEDHNLANDFLGFPRLHNSLLTFRSNAVEVRQAF